MKLRDAGDTPQRMLEQMARSVRAWIYEKRLKSARS
jgi:hypothetical protein